MPLSLRFTLPVTAVLVSVAVTNISAQETPKAVAARAEGLARAGNTVEAQQLVLNALRQSPGSIPLNVVAGELEAFRHAWGHAMEFYEAALRVDSQDEPAHEGEVRAATALALHLRATGDQEGALATLEHAHAVLPRDAPLTIDLALQAQSMHRLKLAHDSIDTALSLSPGNDRALYAAAGIAFDRGNTAEAAQHYRDFVKQHPDDASAHYGLGRALRLQQKFAEAREELERSVALQPVQTEAYYQLGELALESGLPDEARAAYAKTLSRMPAHGGALTGMGMLAYRAHAYADARAFLDKAVAAAPDYQPAHYYLGLTLRRLGLADAAAAELQTATNLATTQQGKGNPVAAQ